MKTLKKLSALLLIAVMLCMAIPFAVSAEDEITFWLTHFNNNTVEGSGVIFTRPYDGAVWWIHVAFKPVAGYTDVYEIVNISDGTPDGSGVAQAIPEGGFVYASNYGNDYISLGMGDTDYTSEQCRSMIAEMLTWNPGDRIVLHGVDLENLTVPTSTPDINWYDDGYVCDATFEYFHGSNGTLLDEPGDTSSEEPEQSSEAESQEDTAPVSEPDEESTPAQESVPAEESTPAAESTAAEESPAESSAPADSDGGLSTGAIIGIIAAAVVVIGIIVCVIVKKKK